MRTVIIFIRHGETAWNQARRIQGHTDIPLSLQGLKQAEHLGNYLVKQELAAIYSSDLKRAVATAKPTAMLQNLLIAERRELRERYYGEWEGQLIDEMKKARASRWAKNRETTVEDKEVAKHRVLRCLEKIAQDHLGTTVAVVSHGGVIRSVLQEIGGDREELDWGIPNTAVSELHYEQEGWSLQTVASLAHLQKEG